MKKILLLFLTPFFFTLNYAQKPDSIEIGTAPIWKLLDRSYNPDARLPLPLQKGTRASEVTPIGTSYNIYSILHTGTNQVDYNSDLNVVTFTHRQNDGNEGGSGLISFDVSMDGGASWPSQNIDVGPITPNTSGKTSGCRYPEGAIYNPLGNTDPANAYLVSYGPALLYSGTKGWGSSFEASAKLDGSNVADNYTSVNNSDNNFFNRGLCQNPANGDMFTLLTRFHETNQLETYKEFYVMRGSMNEENPPSFDWSVQRLIEPPLWEYNSDRGKQYMVADWDMAFSPNGQTGYAVIVATDKNYMYYKAPRPRVWKTTDAGETWTALKAFDFSSITQIKDSLFYYNHLPVPYFSEAEITVDKNGALHMIAEIMSGTESAGFVYTHFITKHIFHVYSEDGVEWEAACISDIVNDVYTYGSGNDAMPIENHYQISRCDSGKNIFMTWTETDTTGVTSGTGSHPNDKPNLWGVAYDVDTKKYISRKNLTGDTDAAQEVFFPKLAPVSITGGDDYDYEIPVVFAQLTTGGFESGPLSPPQYNYIKGIGFNKNEYPLDADFTASDTLLQTGESINFTDLTTGAVSSWNWTFEGAETNSSTDQHPSGISYNSAGTYEVSLTIGDGDSDDTETKSAYIVVADLLANFSANRTNLNAGEEVNFTDKSIGNVTSWTWTFEGAETTSSTDQNPSSIVWNDWGKYTVSLTVSDGDNEDTQTFTDYIYVFGAESIQTLTQKSVQLYPNPARESVFIDFGNYTPKKLQLIVYDQLGKIVKKADNNKLSANRVKLNLSDLDKGLYFVRCATEKGNITKKLILTQ